MLIVFKSLTIVLISISFIQILKEENVELLVRLSTHLIELILITPLLMKSNIYTSDFLNGIIFHTSSEYAICLLSEHDNSVTNFRGLLLIMLISLSKSKYFWEKKNRVRIVGPCWRRRNLWIFTINTWNITFEKGKKSNLKIFFLFFFYLFLLIWTKLNNKYLHLSLNSIANRFVVSCNELWIVQCFVQVKTALIITAL